MDKILSEIRKTEAEAKKIVESSMKESEKSVTKAQAGAGYSYKKEIEESAKKEQDAIADKEKELETVKKGIMSEAEKKSGSLEKSYKKNIRSAVELAINLFEDEIGLIADKRKK